MDALANLLGGLLVALEPSNLAMAFVGAALGTAIGVIPGLGPTATVSLLLPVSVMIDPISAVILLAGMCPWRMQGLLYCFWAEFARTRPAVTGE